MLLATDVRERADFDIFAHEILSLIDETLIVSGECEYRLLILEFALDGAETISIYVIDIADTEESVRIDALDSLHDDVLIAA